MFLRRQLLTSPTRQSSRAFHNFVLELAKPLPPLRTRISQVKGIELYLILEIVLPVLLRLDLLVWVEGKGFVLEAFDEPFLGLAAFE